MIGPVFGSLRRAGDHFSTRRWHVLEGLQVLADVEFLRGFLEVAWGQDCLVLRCHPAVPVEDIATQLAA